MPVQRTRPKKRILSLSLRSLLIYFLAVVGPAVTLLFLGIQAVERQRQAVTSLSVANLRLSGERLVSEMERRVWRLAEVCLRDQELIRVSRATDNSKSCEAVKRIRAQLEFARHRHPIARHFFVLQGNALRFPLLEAPLPQLPDVLLARESLGVRQQFKALLAEGEDQELLKQRPDLALLAYKKSSELRVSDPLKALALSRAARCLQKMKKVEEAKQAYQTILAKYADVYDPGDRPYALVAALELNDLATGQRNTAPQPLLGIYEDLVRGRWELSAEQMDYFVRRFQDLAKDVRPAETVYLHHLELGRALRDGLRHQGPLQPDKVYTSPLARGAAYDQIFYTPISSSNGQELLLGFSADVSWIESQLLPQCKSELETAGSFGYALTPSPSASSRGNPSEVIVAFKTVFPFWGLSATTEVGQAQQSVARREILVFVGAILLVLGVLGLGIFLLMRDAGREMQLARLRGDLVSGVSHELRTPLTLIGLYNEMLHDGQNLQEEERRSYCQIISGEVEKLTHLVEKVLDFSRTERGLKQYSLSEGDLAPVITRTVEVYKQYLSRQGFFIETTLAASLPPVRFDPEAVSQAVLNLMDNAARYSGESKFIRVGLKGGNGQAILEVEDRGPGIAAGDRGKIFDQFYRGPNQAGKGGYGLGLYLVKHIMEAHGGSIELESEAGRGSVFRLIFPCLKS